MSDEIALLAANRAYYKAFADANVEAMNDVWGAGEVSCVHPGWPAIIGRDAVLASYRDILRNPNQERIDVRNEKTILSGEDGRVVCIELVGGTALVATN
jgi:hypothetical protein